MTGVLLEYQRRWFADRSPVKVCEKSRRVGISWAMAAEAVTVASMAGGMDVWFIGYSRDMAIEFIRDCTEWARWIDLSATVAKTPSIFIDADADTMAYNIRFASGFRITALSSRPSNLRGKQGLVIIDEAAFHDNLDGLMKAGIAMLMWGGRLAIISTHYGRTNPFNSLVDDIHAGKRDYSLHRVTLKDALADGLYKRITEKAGADWTQEAEARWEGDLRADYGEHATEELDCVPSKSGGLYFPQALVERCMIADGHIIRWDVPDALAATGDTEASAQVDMWLRTELCRFFGGVKPGQMFTVGQDFGRVSDLSSIAIMRINPDMTRTVVAIVELFNAPFRAQEQILNHICSHLPVLCGVAVDGTGNGAYLGERMVQHWGEAVATSVAMTGKWYGENLPPLKAAFEDEGITLPRDLDVLADMMSVRIVEGQPRLPKTKNSRTASSTDGGKMKTRHGDAAVAIALAFAASRNMAVGGYHGHRVKIPKHERTPRIRRGTLKTGGWL